MGCKHAPQTADAVDVVDVDDDDDAVLVIPVEVIVGDLWWLSLGDDTFIFATWFVCKIGVGLICAIIFDPSTTMPDEIDAPLRLLQLSFNICDVCCMAVEHFISMGTEAGVLLNMQIENDIKVWLDNIKIIQRTFCWLNI